jgi:hypothetical protein
MRIAGLVKQNAGNPDARIIPARHEAWEEIELSVPLGLPQD